LGEKNIQTGKRKKHCSKKKERQKIKGKFMLKALKTMQKGVNKNRDV
jgi:hypothetical protein